jgi:hypothetical protein
MAMFEQDYEENDYIGFEMLVNPDLYNIQVKLYKDKNRCLSPDHMVLFGTYHYHHGRQLVWVRPTGLEVEYYHGLPDAFELARVEDRFVHRIYYIPPFLYMSTLQEVPMNKVRRYSIKVVEIVINVVFLKQAWLVDFETSSGTNALEAFRDPCINYEPRKLAAEVKASVKKEKEDSNEVKQASAWGRQNDPWNGGPPSPRSSRSDSYSPRGTSSPNVKAEPKDETNNIFGKSNAHNSGSRTHARSSASLRRTPLPSPSRSPIRRTLASGASPRKYIDCTSANPS